MSSKVFKKPFSFHLHITEPTPTEQGRRRGAPATDPWIILGHDGRLGQVMGNLIENARTFLPATGGRIDVGLKREGRFAVITVRDNGPGIPPENTKRVFERFYTDRPIDDGFGQNSGLGLSITQQIVEAHGGSIVADNVADKESAENGTGAVFTVRLPLLLGKVAGIHTSVAKQRPPKKGDA